MGKAVAPIQATTAFMLTRSCLDEAAQGSQPRHSLETQLQVERNQVSLVTEPEYCCWITDPTDRAPFTEVKAQPIRVQANPARPGRNRLVEGHQGNTRLYCCGKRERGRAALGLGKRDQNEFHHLTTVPIRFDLDDGRACLQDDGSRRLSKAGIARPLNSEGDVLVELDMVSFLRLQATDRERHWPSPEPSRMLQHRVIGEIPGLRDDQLPTMAQHVPTILDALQRRVVDGPNEPDQ